MSSVLIVGVLLSASGVFAADPTPAPTQSFGASGLPVGGGMMGGFVGTDFMPVSKPMTGIEPGEQFQVTFTDGKTDECSFSHRSNCGNSVPSSISDLTTLNFTCTGAEGETLLTGNQGSWQGVELSPTGKASVRFVQSIDRAGTLYFKSAKLAQSFGDLGKTLDQRALLLSDANLMIFDSHQNPKAPSRLSAIQGDHWSPEFSLLYRKLKDASLAQENEMNERLSSIPEVRVKFSNGTSASCKRGKTSTVPLKAPFSSTSIPCELFLCGPVNVDGKKYIPLLNLPSDPSGKPTATLFSPDQGTGPVLKADSVTDSSGGEEIYQNRFPEAPDSSHSIDSWMMNPGYLESRNFLKSRCTSPEVVDHVDRENAWIKKKMIDANSKALAVLVNDVNGALSALQTPEASLPSNACRLEGDTYLTPAGALKYFSLFKTWDKGDPSSVAVSPEEADRLFKEVAAMRDIPFRYVEDGCYARAEIMSDRLAKEGVTTEKVWAEGGVLQPKPDLQWSFHVAPVVWVKEKNGSYDRRVLDPSLEDHAVTVDTWLSKFRTSDQGKYVTLAWPLDAAWEESERTMVYYTPSSVYLQNETSTPDPAQYQKDVQSADQVLADYLKVQEHMDQKANP